MVCVCRNSMMRWFILYTIPHVLAQPHPNLTSVFDEHCLARPGNVRPVGSHPRTHQGPHFRSAAATLENVGIDLARPGTGGNARQR